MITSPNVTLQDSGGNLWALYTGANGILNTQSLGPGSASNVFLNDPGNTTSWQLGVTTAGIVITTSVTFNAS